MSSTRLFRLQVIGSTRVHGADGEILKNEEEVEDLKSEYRDAEDKYDAADEILDKKKEEWDRRLEKFQEMEADDGVEYAKCVKRNCQMRKSRDTNDRCLKCAFLSRNTSLPRRAARPRRSLRGSCPGYGDARGKCEFSKMKGQYFCERCRREKTFVENDL